VIENGKDVAEMKKKFFLLLSVFTLGSALLLAPVAGFG
jgi:hypothetical protein